MNKRGFTLAESMMVLAMLSVIIVLVMPVMTSRKIMPEQEQNTLTCIKKEGAANISSTACAAVEDLCVGNQSKSCSSLVYLADNGKTAEKAAARKVLKEVCDKGGREACKYIVDSCKKDAAACDISTTATDDLRYYLTLGNNDNGVSKQGRLIVKEITNGYYTLNALNIVTEVKDSCSVGSDKTACSILIQNCNEGIGCINAYNVNANRTCGQIHAKWPTAVGKGFKDDDIYTVNPTDATSYDLFCNMTNPTDGGGWTRIADVDVKKNRTPPAGSTWLYWNGEPVNTSAYWTQTASRVDEGFYIKGQINGDCSANIVSASFPTYGISYSKVLINGVLVPFLSLDGDSGSGGSCAADINIAFIDGASFTYNDGTRKHIFTFTPATGAKSTIYGTNVTTNPVITNRMVTLGSNVAAPIELRLMSNQYHLDEDIGISKMQIYVK